MPKVIQLAGVSLVVWFLLSLWGQLMGIRTGVFGKCSESLINL